MGWGLARAFRVWLFPRDPSAHPLLSICTATACILATSIPALDHWPLCNELSHDLAGCNLEVGWEWRRNAGDTNRYVLFPMGDLQRPRVPSGENLNSWTVLPAPTTQHCLSRFFFHFSLLSLKMPLSASSAWKAPCSKISSLLLIPIHHLRLSLYVTSSGKI